MVAYTLALRATQPLIAVIAAHGLTDLDSFACVLPYAAWCLVPNVLVTPAFVASSIFHFADDVGRKGSALLHGAVGFLCLLCGKQLAFEAMMLYLAVVHVPMHYGRCLRRGRVRGVGFAAAVTIVLVAFSRQVGDSFLFGNWLQRIAAAHIVHEAVLEHRCPLK